jgi:predicted 3-demethylubiquinone-9 3-methyltransferase (glyoxalase superfamily)
MLGVGVQVRPGVDDLDMGEARLDEPPAYWDAIVGNGGQESACGWCKDRWGFSWQITPRVLLEATTDPDRAAAKRAMEAMMTMRKIDIATIEAARRGEG